MRNLRRVYQRPDGEVSVVMPAWDDGFNGFGKTAHKTEAEWYEWAVTQGTPSDWISKGDVDVAALPTRSFRSCWRWNNGVKVDPTLETTERWVRVRAERGKRLVKSDGVMFKLSEQGTAEQVAAYKAYRQALRDVPTQPDPKNITWPVEP